MDRLANWFWGFLDASGCHSRNDIFNSSMATSTVPNKLIFSVIINPARAAVVRFLLEVTALMVVAITDGCEALGTVLTLIGLLPCVDSHVNKEISSLIEQLFTVRALIVGRAEIANLSP